MIAFPSGLKVLHVSFTILVNFVLQIGSIELFFIVDNKFCALFQIQGEHIKRYRIVDSLAEVVSTDTSLPTEPSTGSTNQTSGGKLIVLELSMAVVDEYEFTVSYEMDMGDTTVKEMQLPIQWAVAVEREKLHFVIEVRDVFRDRHQMQKYHLELMI
jgi:hypothetical protein